MLHFSRWKTLGIWAVIALGVLLCLPNFFSRETLDRLPNWLPKHQMVLGLDLQGGVYLLYEVDRQDYLQKRLRSLSGEVRGALLQEPRIGYSNLRETPNGVQLRLRDASQVELARQRLTPLRNPLSGSLLGGGGVEEFDLNISNDGVVNLAASEAGLNQRVSQIVSQSIEVIERRINQLGTVEPSIQRQGQDRILVEVPGLGDPARLKNLVGQTAQLTFHLVQSQVATAQAQTSRPPNSLPFVSQENPAQTYFVDAAPLLTGDDLADAQASFDQRTNEPLVSFRLNSSGAQKFGRVTQQNVGKPFAIVLDEKVISAPVIREPILGGSGQISGSFTAQTANDLAILLRAGSLPAKLTVVEERTIGPSLGADSIRAGIIACVVATVAIAVFMILCYGLLGFFADIALIANNALMIGILTAMQATLTLPGIAGIVLTMGMAVDANVLIYERIREERMEGKSVIQALDAGFRRAFATIIDSHLTALIAAIALFWLGSGPVRGFAVTMAIGIVSTLFTSYLVTRLIVASWARYSRPKTIPL
ncbi:protein translocase subunit SecD [Mesorhizobium sp. RP14(2022)]|uniref:Protein translocase subunit SecD n=1 Tax=Mesorhizobium liriopis TaxID=2953882 RepID=A0ABT1CB21_9HYPH|nr:protein translocase subunit SecD [Mesorhizobium liriopis]MCO6052023.1 protein translocase subunit SecD [Mesorhizobium liriopis]